MKWTRGWDTKACLWSGMVIFMFLTIGLAILKVDKEFVMASFGLTGQLVAALMTYVNSMKSLITKEAGTNETKPNNTGTPAAP